MATTYAPRTNKATDRIELQFTECAPLRPQCRCVGRNFPPAVVARGLKFSLGYGAATGEMARRSHGCCRNGGISELGMDNQNVTIRKSPGFFKDLP